MWHTPGGDRFLQGAEAELVRRSLANMVDELRLEADGLVLHLAYGVEAFDRLPWPRQLAGLADVGEALLRADVPALPLAAWNQAAAAAIFINLRDCIRCEIDAPSPPREAWEFSWLRLVAAADAELASGPPQPAGGEGGVELIWEEIVAGIERGILGDADNGDREEFRDVSSPTRRVQPPNGAGDDYFTAVPPDPTPAELRALWRRLEILTAGE